MRKLLTSNLIAMVWTKTDSRFDVTESVPKLKELLIIQDISNSLDPSMDTTITTKLYIPVWETDTGKYVPSLPSWYDDHYIKVSQRQTTDQSTWDICLEIGYNYYDRICHITFSTNTNGDSIHWIRYSEWNIAVPYTSEMRIIPSYSTPQWPTSIQFWYDNTTREVTAIPEHESLYILWFTYHNTSEDFINEWEGILIYDDTTLYWWQSSDYKMDVLLDCTNWDFVDSGDTVYCWKYTSTVINITMNRRYTSLEIPRRNNNTIYIDRIVPTEWYKADAIEVKYWWSTIATISPDNIEQRYFESRNYPWVLTVIPHIIVDPWDYNFDSEYHAFPNNLWYGQGLGNDAAFLTSLNNIVQSYWWTIPSGASGWYCQTLQYIEKQKSCVTQNYSYWCILACFDWSNVNWYVIAIDVTDLMWTYIRWSPYQQQQSSLNSWAADQIKAKVDIWELSVYHLSSYPPGMFNFENKYTCLVSDNPNQYEQLLREYNDLKNWYIGWNKQLP